MKGMIYHLTLYQLYTNLITGGRLGFFCNHGCAYAHNAGRRSFPGALKGVNLAVYLVFRNLGLIVDIHLILRHPRTDTMGGMSLEQLTRCPRSGYTLDHVEKYLEKIGPPRQETSKEDDAWDKLYFCEEYGYERPEHMSNVGTKLQELKIGDTEGSDSHMVYRLIFYNVGVHSPC